MADRLEPELPYGHFGLAKYDHDDKKWHFARARPAQVPLRLLCIAQQSNASSENSNITGTEVEDHEVRSARYAKQISALRKSLPGVHLPTDILPSCLRLSESVQEAASFSPLTRGDLIAFSSVYSSISKRSAPIVAVAGGSNGSEVRTICMRVRRYEMTSAEEPYLDVPALQGKEATWRFDGAPICQLLFSPGKARGQRKLVVRYPTKICILRPEFVPGQGSLLRLSMTNIIDTEQVQWQSFADAVVNPWDEEQIGLMNAEGHWSVVGTNGKVSSVLCKDPRSNESPEEVASLRDGWARVGWVASFENLLVCTRGKALLFRIGDGTGELVQDISLDMLASSPWLFDVRIFQRRPAWFCALTSTHLVLFQVAMSTREKRPAKLKAKLRHFRNFEDLSTTMTLCEEEDQTLVVLTSSSTSVPMSFRVLFDGDDLAVLEDPQRVPIAAMCPKRKKVQHISSLAIRSVRFGSAQETPDDSTDDSEGNPRTPARFYSFATLYDDMTISEALLVSQYRNARDVPSIVSPSWKLLKQSSSSGSGERGFVVDDSDVSDREAPLRQEPRPIRYRGVGRRPKRSQKLKDLSKLVMRLEIADSEVLSRALPKARAKVTQLSQDETQTSRTIMDLIQHEVTTGDTEDAARALEQLTQSFLDTGAANGSDEFEAAEPRLVLENVPSLGRSTDRLSQGTGLGAIYDEIVATWITPLAADISARTRVARDQLARNMAAELTLSSLVIRPSKPPILRSAESEDPPQSYSFELPVRGVPPTIEPFSSQLYSSQLPDSAALPTPSPTTTPSVTTASSRATIFAAPEVDRLRRYANFTKPAPAALPRALNNVLAHWEVGSDLSTYDWLSTARQIARRDEEADEELSERDRLRMQKRAQRHLRRQRREAEASQALRLASSRIPEVLSASQPPVVRTAESQRPAAVVAPPSSQSIASAFPASQPVSGRFAVRQPVKKKRKQGF